jgi:hypothetical protein
MRFVMTKSEVAVALALPVDEFEQRRVELEKLGFPSPIAGLGERWSIIAVINWINRRHSERLATHLPAMSTLPH